MWLMSPRIALRARAGDVGHQQVTTGKRVVVIDVEDLERSGPALMVDLQTSPIVTPR